LNKYNFGEVDKLYKNGDSLVGLDHEQQTVPYTQIFLGRPTGMKRRPKVLPMNFLPYLFYQSTTLNNRTVGGHQMYS